MVKKEIILVDKNDKEIGAEEKMAAHREGKLHRCFSVFVFNNKGQWLLQKRALSKYHSPGLWTNACCSHPRPGKDIKKEAGKRLKEEMGFTCPLKEVFTFHYKAKVPVNILVKESQGLIENEIDHVFIGRFNGKPKPNPAEVGEWLWLDSADLQKDIKRQGKKYAAWFKKIIPQMLKLIETKNI